MPNALLTILDNYSHYYYVKLTPSFFLINKF